MSPEAFRKIASIKPKKFAHLINKVSAFQSDKFVFSMHTPAPNWLEKQLKRRAMTRGDAAPALTQWAML